MADKNRAHIQKLREEANAIRRQEEKKSRRNRLLTQLGIIAGAVVVLGAIVALAVLGPTWFSPKIELEAKGTVAVPTSAGGSVDQPISASGTDGVVVGAEDAPVKVDYYFDYSCPHCVQYHQTTGTTYNDLVASGDIQVTYHAMNIVAPYGAQAGSALGATVAKDPSQFFAVHEGLFSIPAQTQTNWGPGEYASALESFGVTNADVVKATANGEFVKWVEANTSAARDSGVNGTPSIWVNGEQQQTLPDAAALEALVAANAAK